VKLVIEEKFNLLDLVSAEDEVSIVNVRRIDAFGALSLLHLLRGRAQVCDQKLTLGDPYVVRQLEAANFFKELTKFTENRVAWDDQIALPPQLMVTGEVFTSIRFGQTNGDECRIADDFKEELLRSGFGEGVLNAGNVLIGEGGANSHTHTQCPSHIAVTGTIGPKRLIRIGLADNGEGIQSALRGNSEYSVLSDDRALLTALRKNVSGWENVKRGKGMTEFVKWTMAFHGVFRVDSNDQSAIIDCRGENPTCVSTKLKGIKGTRLGIILEDRTSFTEVGINKADELVAKFLGEL
jgi:hypothetical protein